MTIGYSDPTATAFRDNGTITVQGMHKDATRIETLRIVDNDGSYVDYNFGEAYLDGVFGTTSQTGLISTNLLPVYSDLIATIDLGDVEVITPSSGETLADYSVRTIADYETGSGAQTEIAATVTNQINDWMDDLTDAFELIPYSEEVLALAEDAYNQAETFVVPETPDYVQSSLSSIEDAFEFIL